MTSTHFECLFQCGKPNESADSIENMTQGSWEKLKLKSLNVIDLEMCMKVWIWSLDHIYMQLVDLTYQTQAS